MNRQDRFNIQWWLAFKPHTEDDYVRKCEAFDELMPLVIDENRGLRHELHCLLTQSGEQVEVE